MSALDISLDDIIKQRQPQKKPAPKKAPPPRAAPKARGGAGTQQRRQQTQNARKQQRGAAADRRRGMDVDDRGGGRASIFERLGGAAADDATVTVRNVPSELQELFAKVGKAAVSVAYDASGRSKGSATVSFANARQAKAAVAKYDGATIDGRALKVALAADDDAAPPRGRAGSGGAAGGKNVRAGLFGTALRGLGGGGGGGRGGGGGKLIHIALFDDEEAAARAYNAKIAELGLNRKTNPEVGGALVEKPGMSSEFHGVAWYAQTETWQTQVTRSTKCGLDGKKQHLGYYDDEHSAALAADAFRRVATPGHEPHKINFPTLPELRKERLKTPMRVILTRDSNGTRRTIRGRLTKVKYDPSVQNRSAWSYRVDFEGHETEAADLGLKKRLWDTLVGDDSKFVSCTLAPDEKKKTRARA
ncbi:hypothetical protein AURANDRAFT_69095 [Aureococcus anophagefferens]|uniref:RRM domain-containing protein n=1 Tax=Aureococcus anophagefferens TaxID=44056 RepID=F0YRQ0_AURAN|nr:hypothetical protein AURANDRAFT_69095 [Aureococcus anophagefferens]EGB02209.1 hypothetical protein AURANDRAFT_69095 [Aureococcus anophagefferens]|eukprot:XP_009043092.1 hypothetical protein AURANDRAFT_69095 [Aureococcus anophagefferens]